MKRKIVILTVSMALLPAGCVFGMLKTVAGMAQKGREAYPETKSIFDKNPTIVATAANKFEIRHNTKTGKEAGRSNSEYFSSTASENMTAKAAKDLSAQLAKSYPLKNLRFQPDLKILLSAGSLAKAMTLGGDIERVIPETVTEDYVFLSAIQGTFVFTKNGKRNIHGEFLGDLHYSGGFSAELIDTKTKKIVVMVNLGKASQIWPDVTEPAFDQMVSQRSVGSYGPDKAYAEMIASSKNALSAFVTDVKAAKPPQEQK
jgi:hypothetical protein